jgi:hypothetical protein
VTQLLARDMDNDPLVFGVSGEEASRFFAVEPDTGVVWLRQPLDREVRHSTPESQPFSGGQWRQVAHHLLGEDPLPRSHWTSAGSICLNGSSLPGLYYTWDWTGSDGSVLSQE